MAKKFFQLPRLAQIILLILPVVGWIVELVIRWSAVLEKFTLLNLVAALIYTQTFIPYKSIIVYQKKNLLKILRDDLSIFN